MPDASAATHTYQGYRYTIVTQPGTAEAEQLWWDRPGGQDARWRYFRRHVAPTGAEAARRVEADFREWVEGQMEAEGR